MMATSKPPQILELTPSSEILFEGPFEHVVTSYLELRNPSDKKVCFKVKTTAPRRYCVRPNSGIVDPGSKIKIAIMLQPIDQDISAERNKHKFMVQSTLVRDSGSNLETVWAEASQEEIMDSKLRCVFQMPESATAAEAMANTVSSATNTTSKPTNTTNQQSQTVSSQKPQQSATDVQSQSRSRESQPNTSSSPAASSPVIPIFLGSKKVGSSNPSKPNLKKTDAYDADKSIASSHNLTSSFLQPMSDDYKIVLVSLAMLFIGVILGKYII